MKREHLASMLLAPLFLAGCAGGTPDCGSDEVLELLDQAVEREVEKYAPHTQRGSAQEFMGILDNYQLTNIRTLGYDDAIDSHQCDARVTYVYQDRERSMDFTYRVDTDQSSGEVLIEYQNEMLTPIVGYAVGL